MGLKKYFFKREIKRSLSRGSFVSWGGMKSLLILFDSDRDEQNDDIKAIISQLKSEGKSVTACGYLPQKKSVTPETDAMKILNSRDIGIWGKPKRTAVQHILDKEYDVVMDLSAQSEYALKYLVVMSKAKMHCGRDMDDDLQIYDFMIKMTPDAMSKKNMAKAVYDEFRHYMQSINMKNR